MNALGIQLDLFEANEELEGHVFELYEKSPNREFKSHVQFLKAESLEDAEDKASVVNGDYWRTQSVRAVDVDYVWKTFEKIHFSYQMCKAILDLESLIDD